MTKIVLKDRVKETTTVTGTADATLLGAAPSFQSFSAIGDGNPTYYAIVSSETGEWEVGKGTYVASGPTLTRDTVIESSNANAKVSFSAGVKDIFITYPADKAIYEEPNGNVLVDDGPLTVVGTGVTGYTSFSAVLSEMYGNVNSFAQSYARNLNDGAEASADMIVYRDNTVSDSANFMDMGINSSNFSSLTWPIFTPSSMYLYGDGGEMFVGSGTDDLIFFAGGVTPSDETARFDKTTKELTTTASINVTGDVNAEGGSFTAPVLTSSTSVLSPANNEFVTKAYVDNAASTGIHIHTPCVAETSSALSAVYTQGGTTFNITDITGTNTVVTSTTHGLSVNDEIWLTTTAGNGLSINTPYFVYATPTTTSLQLSVSYSGPLLTGLTNASGLSYATRANSGVGAYLEASANGVLPIAGVSVSDRVLVYNQLTGYWNGVYTVTSLGSVGSKWKLTRATDADKYEPENTAGLGAGDYFFIQSNSESYVLTTPGAIIIGYTALTYTLFSSVPVYTGTSPINVTGTTISLTTVPATLGGTGTATVATGDLLYGSATDTWSKLPLGSAYKSLVVNGSGTNVEWNAVALNQSSAVSGSLGATNGGTGQNAYTTGDMLYSDASNSLAKLSGNTTTTKKFLTQTGTGSGSAAPVWGTISGSDVSGNIAGNAGSATNVAGGAANKIVYQTGPGATSFIAAPSSSGTALTWNGSSFAWGAAGATITDDATSNTNYYPVWANATSGSMTTAYVTSSKFTFNPSTGTLTATAFVGGLTGNVTGNVSGSSGSCTGNAATATTASALSSATWQRITGNAIDYGSYGSIGVSGTTGGYAGVSFSGVSGTLMFSSGATGFYYSNSTWRVYWDGSGNQINTGNVTAYSSDERLKYNVKPIEGARKLLRQIEGVYFDWDLEECNKWNFHPPAHDMGLLAQRVQKINPYAVHPAPFDLDPLAENGSKSGKNYLTVQYEKMVPMLVQSSNEHDELIDQMQERIAKLEALVAKLTGDA